MKRVWIDRNAAERNVSKGRADLPTVVVEHAPGELTIHHHIMIEGPCSIRFGFDGPAVANVFVETNAEITVVK